MGYINFNPNPDAARVGDCTVRALCKALDMDWERAYALLAAEGFAQHNMPSANVVWGNVLRQHGFTRHMVEDACDTCYTVADFCREFPGGKFVLAIQGHVVCVVDGDWYDTWDSGGEVPLYYWQRSDDK